MTLKVDPHAERGVGIFIKESFIKDIDARQALGKAQLIQINSKSIDRGWH